MLSGHDSQADYHHQCLQEIFKACKRARVVSSVKRKRRRISIDELLVTNNTIVQGNERKVNLLPPPVPLPRMVNLMPKAGVSLAPIIFCPLSGYDDATRMRLPGLSKPSVVVVEEDASSSSFNAPESNPKRAAIEPKKLPSSKDGERRRRKDVKLDDGNDDDYKTNHRLAERKRRREMRDELYQLARVLPPDTMNGKRSTSKYRILTSALDYLEKLEKRRTALQNLL